MQNGDSLSTLSLRLFFFCPFFFSFLYPTDNAIPHQFYPARTCVPTFLIKPGNGAHIILDAIELKKTSRVASC
ncbi:hypothetical protein CPB84DRAFT_1775611 [Gymnopilus junonius]|uniref:Uncharacterized protein n=1 Tax=Gymnopilus junonius TaxID=109634 RepID=A0A9P5NPX9_GYMJU|nr:hypothetical protein CPB84DRAFT_1775611 [Gymnopilus junonius]